MNLSSTQEARREAFDLIEPELNKLQLKVLKGISEFFKEKGKYPRYKKLAEFLVMDQVTVSSRLVELRKAGYVFPFKNSRSKLRGTLSLISVKGYLKLEEGNF